MVDNDSSFEYLSKAQQVPIENKDSILVERLYLNMANIYENKGFNNFQHADSLTGAYLSSLGIADIDGDKDLNLVIAGTSVGSPARATRLYINTGTPPVNVLPLENTGHLTIYPNPSQGTIHISSDILTDAEIKIYSSTGQLVYQATANTLLSTHQIAAPAGIYSIQIESNNQVISRNIILE